MNTNDFHVSIVRFETVDAFAQTVDSDERALRDFEASMSE